LQRSVPEPDLALVERHGHRPWHPGTAELVIEVCAGSVERHVGGKAAVYAAARVPTYWVIDLSGRCAVCHNRPENGGYRQVATLGTDERLSSGIAGLPSILVADALAAAAGRPAR
jgi:Uma2 family endonuclease